MKIDKNNFRVSKICPKKLKTLENCQEKIPKPRKHPKNWELRKIARKKFGKSNHWEGQKIRKIEETPKIEIK